MQVTTYAHLFDQCTQDWYSVASIIEHLLTYLKAKHPWLESVYFRSDEAGCYHNNLLVAAGRDNGERVGITVKNYDFSEPQSGKDICDRILCPLKASIREHCSEGHDILTATDMKEALKQHPVSGTSTSVNIVEKSKEREEDVECLVKDSERQGLIESITHELGLKHPITFDTYDLCEYHHRKKLSEFNVPMRKNILCHFEVNFKSKDKKQILADKLKNVINECECDVAHYE